MAAGHPHASSAQYLPAYARVRAQILDGLETGQWKPGDRIPSENELAPHFGVSVGTVRKALSELVDEGVLHRRQGLGTFIAHTRLVQSQVRYYQFVREPRGTIANVFIKVLGARRVGKGLWTDFLGADPAGYVRLRRLVTVDECPPIFSESYLPATRFGEILTTPRDVLDGVTLYSHLEQRFGTPTLRNEHYLSVTRFPAAVRAVLREPRAFVGCLWEFVALTYREVPIEYRRSYLREMPRRLRLGFTVF